MPWLDLLIAGGLVLVGLTVSAVEIGAAFRSPREAGMEKDLPLPLKEKPEPLALEPYVASTYAPRPYIGLEDPDYTEPIRTWERQQGATYVSNRSRLP